MRSLHSSKYAKLPDEEKEVRKKEHMDDEAQQEGTALADVSLSGETIDLKIESEVEDKDMNINFTKLTSRYNLMSQLFGVKKNQSNGLLNPADIFNAKNQKGIGMANKSVKSDKEIEEIIYESGICVRGMIMNGKSESEMHQMIDVSEEYRQKMFDECKRHFLQENGVANGDTTKRSEVFRAYQLSIKEDDRLKGTWSLQQYEKQYTAALAAAVRAANPNWKNGDSFDASILDSVTRESVESSLMKSGNTLVKRSSVSGSSLDIQV